MEKTELIYDGNVDVIVDGTKECRTHLRLQRIRNFEDAGGQVVEGISELIGTISETDEIGNPLDTWKLAMESKKVTLVMDDGMKLDVLLDGTSVTPSSQLYE